MSTISWREKSQAIGWISWRISHIFIILIKYSNIFHLYTHISKSRSLPLLSMNTTHTHTHTCVYAHIRKWRSDEQPCTLVCSYLYSYVSSSSLFIQIFTHIQSVKMSNAHTHTHAHMYIRAAIRSKLKLRYTIHSFMWNCWVAQAKVATFSWCCRWGA